jgi:hypothetical protein
MTTTAACTPKITLTTKPLQQFDVLVTPYREPSPRRSKLPGELHFVVAINGDEIARSPRRKIAANAIAVALAHYGVEGFDRHTARALIDEAADKGFARGTYWGEGA